MILGFYSTPKRFRNTQLKPHGAIYGQTARSVELARAAVGVAKSFEIAFMGLAGTCHQKAAEEMGVKFIAGILLYSLLEGIPLTSVRHRVVCGS